MTREVNHNPSIHEFIRRRRSPYCFSPVAIPETDLLSIFEAARWAASAYNEQPWRYIVAARDQAAEFGKLLECLAAENREWAQYASVLGMAVAKTTFTRSGEPNPASLHDLGQSVATLTVEAMSRGVYVHQIGGIFPDLAQNVLNVPAGHKVAVGFAMGYPAKVLRNACPFRAREEKPRIRRPLTEIVYGIEWGRPAFDQRVTP